MKRKERTKLCRELKILKYIKLYWEIRKQKESKWSSVVYLVITHEKIIDIFEFLNCLMLSEQKNFSLLYRESGLLIDWF